jgi:hypothetical protein
MQFRQHRKCQWNTSDSETVVFETTLRYRGGNKPFATGSGWSWVTNMATVHNSQLVSPFLEATIHIQNIAYPLLIVLGLVENTLCFLVMNLPSNRSSVMCFYFKMLAISDAFTLIVNLLPRFVLNLRPNLLYVPIIGDLICEFQFFIGMVFFNISIWLILNVAVDRFIVVKFPLKASLWCTMEKARGL